MIQGRWRFLASLKLAVFTILALAVISAVGTITEARYNDALVAQKLVYHSVWMYLIMGLLIVNLVAVMVDRWPWRQHHMAFVLAHIGIIILLFGSWLTKKYGIDGSMAFEIGETGKHVTVNEREFSVIASLDGTTFNTIFDDEVDFLVRPPTANKPYVVNLGSERLEVVDYYHFAFRETEIRPSDSPGDGPAVRFQLENPNVNMAEWLRRDRTKAEAQVNLGPARVVLARNEPQPTGMNEIFLIVPDGSKKIDYVIYNKDRSLRMKGTAKESDTIETGWMGLKFRILRFLPHARENVNYVKTQAATPAASSALKFRFRDKEYWLGLNSAQRLYLEDKVYFVSFGNRRIELGFPLKLNKFTVGTYQGTQRAASYESEVEVPGRGNVLISMNEPLKHEGFTFYQASFERNEKGEAVVSVLSVNHDPGRWIKYLGSRQFVLGSILHFYFKRVRFIDHLTKGNPK